MNTLGFAVLAVAVLVANSALADGVNQRQGAAPATKAKVNRQLASAYAQGGAKDNVTVRRGGDAAAILEIGTQTVSGHRGSSGSREQTIVTGDNTVICLHCRGGH